MNVPYRFAVLSCEYRWYWRSRPNLYRCLLSRLIQESVFWSSLVIVFWLFGSAVLPPNCRFETPAVPSGKVEFTRTVVDGNERYGSPARTLSCTDALVSSRKLSQK